MDPSYTTVNEWIKETTYKHTTTTPTYPSATSNDTVETKKEYEGRSTQSVTQYGTGDAAKKTVFASHLCTGIIFIVLYKNCGQEWNHDKTSFYNYFYFQNSQLQVFKRYLYKGIYINLEYDEEKVFKKNNVNAYLVNYVNEIYSMNLYKKIKYYDKEEIEGSLSKFLNSSSNT